MSDALYAKAKEAFLSGLIDLVNDTIKCVLVDGADYTPLLNADEFLEDVAAGARVGTPQTLASKTVTAGVFDAADVTFTAVSGDECEYILIYQDTGDEATSRLIALIDSASGLPVNPSGDNIVIQWSSGASKIFAL